MSSSEDKMSEWEKLRKEFREKYYHADHEALMNLLEVGDRINIEIEAIQEIIKIPEVWNHPDPISAIREILEASSNSDSKGSG